MSITLTIENPRRTGADLPADPAARLDFIDGLRGLAILLVLLFHVWYSSGAPFPYWWNPLASGHAGVNLFLTLSGFCLYWPFVKPGGVPRTLTLREFAFRRARRLLPPYYVALALIAVASLVLPLHLWPIAFTQGIGQAAQTVLWHVFMLHNLRPEQIMALNGPFWSLALEVDLYIAMPILIVAARRWGIGTAVALAAVVTLTYRIVLDHYIGGQSGWLSAGYGFGYTLCYALPGRWLEFALGMWAASLVANGTVPRHPRLLGAGASFCLLGAVLLSHLVGAFTPFADPLFGLGFFCLTLLASAPTGQGPRASFGALMRVRPLMGLGIISYSVYLLHVPLLELMIHAARPHLGRVGLIFGASLFVFLPVIVVVSRWFFLLVERPFLNNQAGITSRPARETGARAVLRKGIPSAGGAGHLGYVDTLRGFACLWVIALHANDAWGHTASGREPWLLAGLLAFVSAGWLGVHLFLVLSGFCLFYPLIRRQGTGNVTLDTPQFFRRRAWRILPPYYAALAVFVLLHAVPALRNEIGGMIGVKDIMAHVLMVHNLRPNTVASINPAFWSLALECQLYLAFPLLLWLGRRTSLWLVLAVTLAVSVLWQAAVYLGIGLHPRSWDLGMTLFNAMPGRCFEFTLGMMAAALVARPQPVRVRWVVLVAALSLIPGVFLVNLGAGCVPLRDQICGGIFACLVVMLARLPPEWFRRLPVAWLTWTGTISYSLYLVHQPLLTLSRSFVLPMHLNGTHTLALFCLVAVPALSVIGYVFFLVAERPFMTWARFRERPAPVLPVPAA